LLWEFNRFLPEKPCQTGTLVKRLLLMLIDAGLLGIIGIILPPAPSVVQGGSSDSSDSEAWVYSRASVRRASGFVLTGKPEIEPLPGSPLVKFWRTGVVQFARGPSSFLHAPASSSSLRIVL
jgi:hypothetical protein